jgi:hypothetical protein
MALKKIRVPQRNLTIKGNSLTLLLANSVGVGTLEVAGAVDNSFKPPTAPVTAQDDGMALDGDYDNEAGDDFVLPFSPIVIPSLRSGFTLVSRSSRATPLVELHFNRSTFVSKPKLRQVFQPRPIAAKNFVPQDALTGPARSATIVL